MENNLPILIVETINDTNINNSNNNSNINNSNSNSNSNNSNSNENTMLNNIMIQTESLECPICYEAFTPNDQVVYGCGNKHHIHHIECFKKMQISNNINCSQCRTECIFTKRRKFQCFGICQNNDPTSNDQFTVGGAIVLCSIIMCPLLLCYWTCSTPYFCCTTIKKYPIDDNIVKTKYNKIDYKQSK